MLARPDGTPAMQDGEVQKCRASFQPHVRKPNSTHNQKLFLPQNYPRMLPQLTPVADTI